MPSKPLPKRETLKCPRCREDIGGILDYNEIHAWLKRSERRAGMLKRRIKAAERRRAITMLRRIVVMETGMELNISDGGKKLGLKELSLEITKLFTGESQFSVDELDTMDEQEYEKEMAKMVEEKIVDYFTSTSTSSSSDPQA